MAPGKQNFFNDAGRSLLGISFVVDASRFEDKVCKSKGLPQQTLLQYIYYHLFNYLY